MKARVLVVVLFLFLLNSFATAQEETILQKFYAGALYSGSFLRSEYYRPANNVNLLVGARTKISLSSNLFVHTRVMNNMNNEMAAHVWLERKIKSASFNAGFLPRPIKMINTPDPVSAVAHFLPQSKRVIPGPALGVMAKISSAKISSDFYAGVYQAKEDSLEFNFAVVKSFPSKSLLRKITIGGYSAKGASGVSLSVDIWRLSLMGFSSVDARSISTHSAYGEIKLGGFNLCADAVNRQDIWETAELRIVKELAEDISGVRVNYLCGLGYIYREIEPDLINFYLQVWFDKK